MSIVQCDRGGDLLLGRSEAALLPRQVLFTNKRYQTDLLAPFRTGKDLLNEERVRCRYCARYTEHLTFEPQDSKQWLHLLVPVPVPVRA